MRYWRGGDFPISYLGQKTDGCHGGWFYDGPTHHVLMLLSAIFPALKQIRQDSSGK